MDFGLNCFAPSQEHSTCQLHPTQDITHICCARSCLTPLCGKCIKEHINIHKVKQSYSEIESVVDLHESCASKLRSALVSFSAERSKLEQLSTGSINDHHPSVKKLRSTKQSIIDMVAQFFDGLERQYINLAGIDTQLLPSTQRINELLDRSVKTVQKLDKLYTDLEKKDPLRTIQHLLTQDLDREFTLLHRDIDAELGTIFTASQSVKIDQAALDNLRTHLEQIVSLHQGRSTHSSFHSTSALTSHSKVRSFTQPTDYSINVKDYFDPNVGCKYLHFFQHKSSYLHLLDLDTLQQGYANEFEKINLNINFKIPRWHRSIVTPFCEIYLTGGVDVDNPHIKLDKAYVYDFNNKTLIPISPMFIGRSGHAMTYLNGYLYVIGGYSEEKDFTERCERYNIKQNMWEHIASLHVKANNPACCTFRNKYIYKFGGKLNDLELCNTIERYDPLSDLWSLIEIELPSGFGFSKKPFSILSSLASVQINNDQMIVFGGTHADYSIKSNDCWLLHVDEVRTNGSLSNRTTDSSWSHRITGVNESNLPYAEGFWSNQVVVDQRQLYCLQNVPNEKNENVVYLDRRRVLVFDSEYRWRVAL